VNKNSLHTKVYQKAFTCKVKSSIILLKGANVSEPKKTNPMHIIYDFAIIIGVSFAIYYTLAALGAPLWLVLAILITWGAITGYKPKIFRKPFEFLYRD